MIPRANELYIAEEQKLRVNDNNVVGGKSEIQLSLGSFLEKERNEFGDLILIIGFIKMVQFRSQG